MFALLKTVGALVPARVWMIGAACAALFGLVVWSHHAAYQIGRESVIDKLQSDRVTILQDGRRIDEKVLNSDDSALCDLLGGCGLSDGENH